MFYKIKLVALLSVSFSIAAPTAPCTANIRLAGAEQVVYSYNLVAPGASAVAFRKVPFAADCTITIAPNGLPAVPFALNGEQSYDFAVETRQVFTKVTGKYVDFPTNGTTEILTNVTLGALHTVSSGVTFAGYVFLDYTDACEIKSVRAFATVPSDVLGLFYPNIGV